MIKPIYRRRLIVSSGFAITTLVIIIGAVVVTSDSDPLFWPGIGVPALTARYGERVYFRALESQRGDNDGTLMVHTMGVAVEMLPDRSGFLPISSECELTVVINDTAYDASSLTEELFASLGARFSKTEFDKRHTYFISDHHMDALVSFEYGKPVNLEVGLYSGSPMAHPTKVDSLGLSWKGKAPQTLPMSYSESRGYFGNPMSIRKRREM